MKRQELYEAVKRQVIAEDQERRKRLLECDNITDEGIRSFMFAHQEDELGLAFIKLVIDVDEKLDKILEKLG